jgi:DNA gyrase subunit A
MPENVSDKNVLPVAIEDEMRKSYVDYAMSVIIGRALPDIRDGLKPAHRRILYAMWSMGLMSNKKHIKCAKVVGEVLGKYHPHGDAAAYDTLVRMAQEFNMRYPLIDGQGNFGSVDGDPPAAYRYTEARLTRLAEELLADIDKETVDFTPTFDDTTTEPTVLPSRFPNLLVNGSAGIAVGMATNIPPHNLGEAVDAAVHLLRRPAATVDQLMKHLPGPDFPTGAFIYGASGIREAYRSGRGIIQLRARAVVEQMKRDRERIVISEIPYQVNKAKLIEKIAELIHDKRLEGISDLRDESDREGMRIVVELKQGENSRVVLNNLYALTQLQDTFGIILLAIERGRPRVVDLKELLQAFLDHRREVITRRALHDLRKAEERLHILEGYKKALEHLDEVIKIIRGSSDRTQARERLIARFRFSEIQAKAILDMTLGQLTKLDHNKILEEYAAIKKLIATLEEILASEDKKNDLIAQELESLKSNFGDKRRTEIIENAEEITIEDMIADEEMVITCSHTGYIKRNPVSLYREQRRGGKGRTGMTTREEDFVERLFVASTHDYVLFFTERGRVHWLKVHAIPQVGPAAKGKAIVNLLQLDPGEKIAAMLAVRTFEPNSFILMGTVQGTIKKTRLDAFARPKRGGIIALGVESNDRLLSAVLTDGNSEVLLATRQGKAIRFHEREVRPMGRGAHGVRGMRLGRGDQIVGMEVLDHGSILTISERGYGKRTAFEEYRQTHRGGSGILNLRVTEKTGRVVGVQSVTDDDDLMIVTSQGKIIRTPAGDIREIGRATQGVRIIRLEEGDSVASVAIVVEKDEPITT